MDVVDAPPLWRIDYIHASFLRAKIDKRLQAKIQQESGMIMEEVGSILRSAAQLPQARKIEPTPHFIKMIVIPKLLDLTHYARSNW